MKEQFLIYNPYLNKMVFYEGRNEKNRVEFDFDKNSFRALGKNLCNLINPKRKTLLEISGFDEESTKFFKRLYQGTKVILNFKEDN